MLKSCNGRHCGGPFPLPQRCAPPWRDRPRYPLDHRYLLRRASVDRNRNPDLPPAILLGGSRQRADDSAVPDSHSGIARRRAHRLRIRASDQNGWSRALHFQSAWAVIFTGLLYVIAGIASGHFRRNLVPRAADLSPSALSSEISSHLRLKRPGERYNTLQRISYLAVIFVLFPLVIWTGLAMSPGFVAVFPATVTTLGGQQSARTIHFFVSLALVLFLAVHLAMIFIAGFLSRTRAMITGAATKENNA